MSTKGVILTKTNPQVGVATGDLRISGMIMNAVAVAGKFDLGTVYKINSLKDAEEILGINAAYDTTNRVVCWHHIREYYEGLGLDSHVELWILGTSQATTMVQMVDIAESFGKSLINGSKGTAFQVGIIRNPDAAYAPTMLDGILDEVLAAIPKAQALVDWAFGKVYPTRIILEGRNFTPPVSGVQDLRAIANVKAPNVSVVTAQDWDYAEKDALFHNYAAVGTLLGTMASAGIEASIGWVEQFNLTDVASERWRRAGLSNHQRVETYEEDWDLLDKKGYVFAQTYPRVDGYRWNNDHTCTPIEVDVEGNINQAYQRYGRAMDAVSLSAYAALIPRVKSPQSVDPSTGKRAPVVIADVKARAERRIDRDWGDQISGHEVIIDKESTLLPPESSVDMAVRVVPMGTADSIKVKLGLVTRL